MMVLDQLTGSLEPHDIDADDVVYSLRRLSKWPEKDDDLQCHPVEYG